MLTQTNKFINRSLLSILTLIGVLAFFSSCAASGNTQENQQQVKDTTSVNITDADIIIDGNDAGREYDGIGAISAGANARLLIDYPEPERSQILDYLYKPGYGASLQILKVEMGGGSNTTAGSDPTHMPSPGEVDCNRGYQWWLMKEAKKRNPDIILYAQQWSAPGWMDGVWSEDNLEYTKTYMECAEEHGLEIDFIGGWNESGFDDDWFVELDKMLKEHFPYAEIPADDGIYQPEEDGQPSDWAVVDSMVANPDFMKAVDQIAMHWPCSWRSKYRNCPSYETARETGKPMQMTNAGMGHDVGGPPNIRGFNRMYIDGEFTSYLIWNTVEAYYSNLPIGNSGIMQARWPWSGFYDVGKNIWAFAHTTQFTEPGWNYLDTGSKRLSDDEMTATIVSLADPSGEDYSMILEALDIARKDTLQLQLENLPNKPLDVWTSNMASADTSEHFQKAGTIVPHDGRFRLVIKPGHVYSLTTTSEQGKGGASPEVKTAYQQLPLPLSESFEDVDIGNEAPFFTNLSAEFEVVPCEGRSGKCYQQMLDRGPIVWNDLGKLDPTVYFGDPRWTGDYTLKTKVKLEEPGYVELIGRINGQRPWSYWLAGYHAQIGTDGWKIYSENTTAREQTTIASGSTSIEHGKWHDLALKMNGNKVTFILNGEELTTFEDENNLERAGNTALRVNKWNKAQFDDVHVVPTAPSPEFVTPGKMKVANVSSAQDFHMGWTYDAEHVVDDRPETRWQTQDSPTPHSITLDLDEKQDIAGLWINPRFDKTNAMITEYRIEVSTDGQKFETVAEGDWPATPTAKVTSWSEKVPARYVRLVALETVGSQASASEIKIITKMP